MSYKKNILIYFIASIGGTLIGWLLVWPDKMGFCANHISNGYYDYGCIDKFELIAIPLLFVAGVSVPVLLILFLSSERIFSTWKKFAKIYLPIAILLIAVTPAQCDAPLGACFDKELTTLWLSGIYLVVSLSIMLFQYLKHKTVQPQKK